MKCGTESSHDLCLWVDQAGYSADMVTLVFFIHVKNSKGEAQTGNRIYMVKLLSLKKMRLHTW